MKFAHKEAYCLMTYRQKGKHPADSLRIWNSRDGVTPFIIHVQGVEMQHADWHDDQYLPLYVPPVGSYVFVNLTLEKAVAYRTVFVNKWWDDEKMPMSKHEFLGPLGKRGAALSLARADMEEGGFESPPDLVRVTPDLHSVFQQRYDELNGSWPYVYRRLIRKQGK